MKLYLTTFLLLVMSLVSCTKNTGIVITKPGSDLILDKMNSGSWNGAQVSNGGNNLNISTGQNVGDYTFESPVLGLGGVYKNDNGTDYILTAPIGNELAVVNMNQEAKEAVDAVLDILDDAGGEAVIGNLISTVLEQKDNIDLSNPDKILADTNIPKEKYEEVKNILSNSANGFTKGEVIK